MKIQAYIDYDERNKIHYYKNFEIIDELPTEEYQREKIKNIRPISLDSEQGNDAVYNYNYYCITTIYEEFDEIEELIYYVATLKRIRNGTYDDIDNSKYYVDKSYISNTGVCSYESGAFDDKYFSTYEEALEYAEKNVYQLDSNQVFQICNMEIEE